MAKGNMLLIVAAFSGFPLLPAQAQMGTCWLRDAASPTASVSFALCEQGSFLVSRDSGKTWAALKVKADSRIRAIAFSDAERGLAVGEQGLVLRTEDGGATWQTSQSGTTEHLQAIHATRGAAWVAGYSGTVLYSGDAGRTWTRQGTPTTQPLESIFFADQDHGWAVGWVGTILRTVDGGRAWKAVKSSAASWSLSSVYFRDAKNGWAVGFAGQILHSRDGGETWEIQPSPVSDVLTSVLFDRAGRGWIAFNDGFLVSEDGGGTWRLAPLGERFFPNKLLRVKDSLWAVGPNGVLEQAGKGLEWRKITDMLQVSLGSERTAPPAGPERQPGSEAR